MLIHSWRCCLPLALLLSTESRAQARTQANRPRLLISSVLQGDFALGRHVADSLRSIIAREVSDTTLSVIGERAMDDVTSIEVPTPPWRVVDLNELAHQLRAALTIDIAADSSSRGVRIIASRLIPPNALRTFRIVVARDRNAAAREMATAIITTLRSVDSTGRVEASTFAIEDSADAVIPRMARRSFAKWRFRPALSAGCPVRAQITVPIGRR